MSRFTLGSRVALLLAMTIGKKRMINDNRLAKSAIRAEGEARHPSIRIPQPVGHSPVTARATADRLTQS